MKPHSKLLAPASLNDLLLYRLSRLVSTASTPVLRLCEGRFGITRREWRMLALLAEHGALQPSVLAVMAQLDRARTSRAISGLVDKKLLRRTLLPSDRRLAHISLTAAGQALFDSLFPLVCDINRALLARLPKADVARLDGLLKGLQQQAATMLDTPALHKADRRKGGRKFPAASASL